ncbi:MAG: carbamoyl phosphate synthase small subunit [Clostridia bacterium]|nr:carbamoyl phosphate synthase small subunit [Clostridia bacterium]
MKGYLVLENGQIFDGERIGSKIDTACEVVFNTGMAGYIETFTDPSYAGQGIVMTYPLIGNYGIIKNDVESSKIWAKSIFIHELAEFESNFRTEGNLESFLEENNIPGLKNVNTRMLTKVLRNSGTMRGYLTSNLSNMKEIENKIKAYKVGKVVEEVTCSQKESFNEDRKIQIALLDYGYKKNILKSLLSRGVGVTVYPALTSAQEILKSKPNGIMLSNGPGDPEDCEVEIENVKKLYNSDVAIFGICLGHQLMALANGFKTAKLKFGHRGPNHPVKDLKNGKVYITSQNHGYYVIEDSIDENKAEVSHINLNDQTVEGISYKNKKVFTVQFHPEACPGPQDTAYLFDKFIDMIGGNK